MPYITLMRSLEESHITEELHLHNFLLNDYTHRVEREISPARKVVAQ